MNQGSMQTKVTVETYRKGAEGLISSAVKTIYDEVKKREFDAATIRGDESAILELVKDACREKVATFLTNILNHDDELSPLYGRVQVTYSAEKKEFDLRIGSSLNVGDAESASTPPSTTDIDDYIELTDETPATEPAAKLVADREAKITQALKDLSQSISDDLHAAFDSTITDLENHRARYKKTAQNYKAAGIALTVLAYMAEAGAIAGTIPLFMQAEQLTTLYHAMLDQIPNFDSYVEFGHRGSVHFTPDFWALDAHGQQAILDVLNVRDQAFSNFMPGVIVVVITAALMAFTWIIAKELEAKGADKVQEEMREKLGIEPDVQKKLTDKEVGPIISQEVVEKAAQKLENPRTLLQPIHTYQTDTTTAVGKIVEKLNGFKAKLLRHAERISEQEASMLIL